MSSFGWPESTAICCVAVSVAAILIPWPVAGSDFWTAASAIATTAAALVALGIGLIPVLRERARMRAEALLQGARLVMVFKAPAASLRAVSKALESQPSEKFSSHHCDVLREAYERTVMPKLEASDLHTLSVLLGAKKSLALATAIGTVECMGDRIEALRLSIEFAVDRAILEKGVKTLLLDAEGASTILREVTTTLQAKVAAELA